MHFIYNIVMKKIDHILLIATAIIVSGCAHGSGFTPPPESAHQSGPYDSQTVLGSVPWVESGDPQYKKPNWWGK